MTDQLILVQPENTRTGVAVWADAQCMVVVCGNCKDTAIFEKDGWRCNVCKREHPGVVETVHLVLFDDGEDAVRKTLSDWTGVPGEDIHIAW